MNKNRLRLPSFIKNVLLAGILSFSLNSCGLVAFAGGAAAGMSAYRFVRGQMSSVEKATVIETHRAVVKSLERLRLPYSDSKYDAFGGYITAKRSDGARIEIFLESEGVNGTKISIRIGIFGDENDSRILLDAIHAELN